MKHRKPYEKLSPTGRWLCDREAAGLPLPPSMQRGTPEYVKGRCWGTLNQRCANGSNVQRTSRNASYFRKNIRLLFSKADFHAWVDRNWSIFDSIYKSGRTPSIDRIDNQKPYTIDNLQVIDLKENMAKDRRLPVVAINVTTNERREYACAKDASRDGFDPKLISRSARKGGTHRGCRWEFLPCSRDHIGSRRARPGILHAEKGRCR